VAAQKLFVNLPVGDLKRSMGFFSGLGFRFDTKFTDDKAACMVVSGEAYVMLLSAPFFKDFTRREVRSADGPTEAIVALSCASRGEVDALTDRALASGAAPAMDPMDHGWMYVRSFYDPDGHHWELFWMGEKAELEG